MTAPRYVEQFLTPAESAALMETLGLRALVRSIVREELAEVMVGKLETLADYGFAGPAARKSHLGSYEFAPPISSPATPPAGDDHAAAPADYPSAGAATPDRFPKHPNADIDPRGLLAAFSAVGEWFDADGNRELLGGRESQVAAVAVRAYVKQLRAANDQLQAVADRQAGDL